MRPLRWRYHYRGQEGQISGEDVEHAAIRLARVYGLVRGQMQAEVAVMGYQAKGGVWWAEVRVRSIRRAGGSPVVEREALFLLSAVEKRWGWASTPSEEPKKRRRV
ncbi:hypothetical protein YIM73518_18250 [Thermus brockianus]|uniref:hypothetical protein n=1 Tax=Thermus hydrothermalis TaxID=2908148 RepID=UPI001FAA8786|nr:hypothetical protein [Thermus hydrothermalis]